MVIPTKVWNNAFLGIVRRTSNNVCSLPRSYDSTVESVNNKKHITVFERHLTMLRNLVVEVSPTQVQISLKL